jgi:hypothetical protein
MHTDLHLKILIEIYTFKFTNTKLQMHIYRYTFTFSQLQILIYRYTFTDTVYNRFTYIDLHVHICINYDSYRFRNSDTDL